MTPKQWSVLLIVTIALTLFSLDGTAASSDPSLDAPIDEFASMAGGASEFVTLCRMQNRPCGFEMERDTASQGSNRKKIHLKNTTARKTLDQIATLHPGHQWSFRNGVLNFEPIHRRVPDMLARKLNKVSIHGVVSRAAFDLVFKQAGIQITGTQVYSGAGGPWFAPVDLEMQNVTVRDALNAIAKADGHVVWLFSPSAQEKNSGGFIVEGWGTARD